MELQQERREALAGRDAQLMRAKRGDLAVIVTTDRTYIIGQPTTERQRCDVGVVTSVTREGVVKRVRTAWDADDAPGRDVDRGWIRPRVLVASSADVDVSAALRIARQHHWPGHPGQPMPWDSLDECRAALKPARAVSV